MTKLVCDQSLIMEAEKLAGGEIHNVKNLICSYFSCSVLANESAKMYKKWKPKFNQAEKNLRVFVVKKKLELIKK